MTYLLGLWLVGGCGDAPCTSVDELGRTVPCEYSRVTLGSTPEPDSLDSDDDSAEVVDDTGALPDPPPSPPPSPPPITGPSDDTQGDDPDLDGDDDIRDDDADPAQEEVVDDGSSAPQAGRIRLFWDYHGTGMPDARLDTLVTHPELEGVIIRSSWAEVEPARGRFDFTTLDEDIEWWASHGKQVVIRNAVFVPQRVGDLMPEWLYEHGVQSVVFNPKPDAEPQRFPIVWNSPVFLTLLEEYVHALAERYDGDPRIAYVWIGVGHLGYTSADASPGAALAFPEAGWTPENWEAYIEAVIGLYAGQFQHTPTLLAVSPLWLRNYMFEDLVEPMKRLAVYAVNHGASLYLNGFDPDLERYAATPFPEMLSSIANMPLPVDFSVLVGDDWPLWVDEERRKKSAHEADRDARGFRAVLDTALTEWNRLARRSDLILVLLKPEMAATNPDNAAYRPEIRAILVDFLNAAEPASPHTGT